MPGTALVVVTGNTGAAVPSTHANVRLAIGKSANELLKLRAALDRTNALDIAMGIGEDMALELVAGVLRCLVPGRVHVLHEFGVSFHERRTSISLLRDLGLFAFMAIMESNDSARASITSFQDGRLARLNGEILVIVPSVDLEGLAVVGLVVDLDDVHVEFLTVDVAMSPLNATRSNSDDVTLAGLG
ncbi:hypothetical protein N7512_001295 [Penicillium capsulatum]|nr:hypothetical protein N7512_001295 [Penicillium capsulatum]